MEPPTFTRPGTGNRTLSLLDDESEKEARFCEWAKQDIEDLYTLCTIYKIESGPHQFMALALELARQLFSTKDKRGRKTKWDDHARGLLVVEMERLIVPGSKPHGPTWAAEQLATREPWRSLLDTASDGFNAPNPAEAIRKQYAIAKNDKWAAVYRDAYRYHETQGELEDWHATIMDLRRK